MAIKFNCEKCKEEILTRFLKAGEVAQCKNCGTDNVVPQNATKTDGEPDYTKQLPEKGTEVEKPTKPIDEADQTPFVPINKILWDDEGPFFKRLWNTWVSAMFRPSTFFRQIPLKSGLKKPYFYSLIFTSINCFFALLWTLLRVIILYLLGEKTEIASMLSIEIIVTTLIIMFAGVFIGIFIGAGLMHLSLLIVGGARKGFEATFRSIAYSDSAFAWMIIPIVGNWIGGIWGLVVFYKGIQKTHGISANRTVYALFVSLLFACCIAGLVMMYIFQIPLW